MEELCYQREETLLTLIDKNVPEIPRIPGEKSNPSTSISKE